MRLRNSSDLNNLKYFTLTHCCGPSPKGVRLLKKNKDYFYNSIPDEALSKTFEEAIKLTVSLGCKYL